MNAQQIQILTYGCFGPPAARHRLWVEPGRVLPISRRDLLAVFVDRVNGHEQVVFSLHGPVAAYAPRIGTLFLTCLELNFDVVARAICRDYRERVEGILIEIINLSLAARAS